MIVAVEVEEADTARRVTGRIRNGKIEAILRTGEVARIGKDEEIQAGSIATVALAGNAL